MRDVGAPTINLQATLDGTDIEVTWDGTTDPSTSSGQATGAGIASYDLEVSVDGGPWESLLAGSTQTSCTHHGDHAHRYIFRLTARDRVSNASWEEVAVSTGNAVTKYYYLPSTGSGRGGGQRVAMRKPDGAVNWLHGDHPSG